MFNSFYFDVIILGTFIIYGVHKKIDVFRQNKTTTKWIHGIIMKSCFGHSELSFIKVGWIALDCSSCGNLIETF